MGHPLSALVLWAGMVHSPRCCHLCSIHGTLSHKPFAVKLYIKHLINGGQIGHIYPLLFTGTNRAYNMQYAQRVLIGFVMLQFRPISPSTMFQVLKLIDFGTNRFLYDTDVETENFIHPMAPIPKTNIVH